MSEYNPEDWENIPQIIPTSIASISRQLSAIESWMRIKDSEETTLSLSLKMNKQENRLQERLDKQINEKQIQISQLNSRIDQANKEIEKLKEKPKIEEAVVQTDLTLKDLENHSDISEDEHSEGEDPLFLKGRDQLPVAEAEAKPAISPSSMNRLIFERILKKKQEDQDRFADMVKPRMYSLDIFKKLMFKYLNRSKLKSKVLIQEQLLPNLEVKTEEISKKVDSTVCDFQLEIKNIYQQMEFYKENLTKLYSEVEEKLKDVSKWSERVEQKFTDSDQVQEDLKVKGEVLREDYDILKLFSKRLEDRLGETSKELKDDIRKKVESSQKIAKKELAKSVEAIETKIAEGSKVVETRFEVVTVEYTKAIEVASAAQETHTRELAQELSQQISDYRKFYECDMETFQKAYNENRVELAESDKKLGVELKKLRTEFDKWVATVMEPAHISEARIFTVEARVKEEEAARLDQLHFIKDVMRKMLFSLEQAQIPSLLPGVRPASRAENDPAVVLFMKRLGFLKKLVQYSVDQQKTRGNFIRRSSPFAGKDHFAKGSVEDSIDAPFITDKSGRFKDNME